jgi:hypothetical protein
MTPLQLIAATIALGCFLASLWVLYYDYMGLSRPTYEKEMQAVYRILQLDNIEDALYEIGLLQGTRPEPLEDAEIKELWPDLPLHKENAALTVIRNVSRRLARQRQRRLWWAKNRASKN